ncbi:MAG TPA: hypothetical protein VKG92_10270 [Flavobacteriales bacterium]|nr:hypothetical protein [Flavobacteriales bacterium]
MGTKHRSIGKSVEDVLVPSLVALLVAMILVLALTACGEGSRPVTASPATCPDQPIIPA